MLLGLALSALATGHSVQAVSPSDASQIVITEAGVARRTEASKVIYCDDIAWRVSWRSDDQGELSELDIAYFAGEQGILLRNASEELADRVSNLDTLSASCNPEATTSETRSKLLLFATDKQTGEPLLGQLVITSGGRGHTWYFSAR